MYLFAHAQSALSHPSPLAENCKFLTEAERRYRLRLQMGGTSRTKGNYMKCPHCYNAQSLRAKINASTSTLVLIGELECTLAYRIYAQVA